MFTLCKNGFIKDLDSLNDWNISLDLCILYALLNILLCKVRRMKTRFSSRFWGAIIGVNQQCDGFIQKRHLSRLCKNKFLCCLIYIYWIIAISNHVEIMGTKLTNLSQILIISTPHDLTFSKFRQCSIISTVDWNLNVQCC